MIVGIIVGIVAVAVIVGFVFVNQPSFGRAPQGERLERIKKSPHYKDGEFLIQQAIIIWCMTQK